MTGHPNDLPNAISEVPAVVEDFLSHVMELERRNFQWTAPPHSSLLPQWGEKVPAGGLRGMPSGSGIVSRSERNKRLPMNRSAGLRPGVKQLDLKTAVGLTTKQPSNKGEGIAVSCIGSPGRRSRLSSIPGSHSFSPSFVAWLFIAVSGLDQRAGSEIGAPIARLMVPMRDR